MNSTGYFRTYTSAAEQGPSAAAILTHIPCLHAKSRRQKRQIPPFLVLTALQYLLQFLKNLLIYAFVQETFSHVLDHIFDYPTVQFWLEEKWKFIWIPTVFTAGNWENVNSQLTTTFVAISLPLKRWPLSFASAGLSKKPPSCLTRGIYIPRTKRPIGGFL